VPSFPAPAPIKVSGYPATVRTCLPDPAEHAGFTQDGAELGYCVQGMTLSCALVDHAGQTRRLESRRDHESQEPDPQKEAAIKAFLEQSRLPALARGDCTLTPPPLKGTWPYPDIVVDVASIARSFAKDPSSGKERLVSQPLVRVGGAVDGEPPVHPLAYSPSHLAMSPPSLGEIPFNVIELNAFVLSPDGTELGIITHANCMEWCDEFQIDRMPVGRLASLVYNDTGFRALGKGKLDRAAELFLRAAYADPARELPAYNLACTYARLNDARADPALALAIARGGDAVAARATKDKDFDAVRAAPWFVKLTAGH
jgi:hypothetical protein